jgi:hypothetical protein
MSGATSVERRCPISRVAVLTALGASMLVGGTGSFSAQAQNGSPGPLAASCGVPTTLSSAPGGGAGRAQPVFQPGQYPVKLPPVSLLGARNDLPNPYRLAMSWGQLSEGRKWGSTASYLSAHTS